jgi:RimJ/RimL family protein N-acetyltransferase
MPDDLIETARLLLRPLSAGDLDALVLVYADPEVMRYIGPGVPLQPDEARRLLERRIRDYDRQGYGVLAVVERDSGAVIGRCGLIHWEIDGRDELEVGYILARSAWGRGYATEAATAVRDFALARLARRRLIALIRDGNAASMRVAEKLGMVHERDIDFHAATTHLYALREDV